MPVKQCIYRCRQCPDKDAQVCDLKKETTTNELAIHHNEAILSSKCVPSISLITVDLAC